MSGANLTTASFVTEVLTTAGKFEKEDINAKLGKLSKKIEEVKVEVYDALLKKYDEFYPNLNTAMDLKGSVETLSTEMEEVGNKIEKEIKSQLQVSTAEFQDLSQQLNESNGILVVLEKLSQLHSLLNTTDECLKRQDYVQATKSLQQIQEILNKPVSEAESEIKILQKLQANFNVQQDRLKDDVAFAWSDNVRWKLPKPTDEGEHVKVELQVNNSNKAQEVIMNTCQAMAQLGILHDKLSLFASRLLVHFVKPIVTQQDAKFKQDSGKEHNSMNIVYSSKASNSEPLPPNIVFQHFVALFHFLDENMSFEVEIEDNGEKRLPLLAHLGNIISADVLDLIINECLHHSIPSSHQELEKYNQVISQTETFQQELVKLKFIKEDNTVLFDFVNNVNMLFANKKCQEMLERARTLMSEHIHNTVEVGENHPFGEVPALQLGGTSSKKSKTQENISLSTDAQLCAKVLMLPACCISTSVQNLVELAYEILQEATHSSQQCAIQLFYCVRNIFELYCSVVPIRHKESLLSLPQQAAIHHNNCMYIAHHLLTLGHQYRNKLPEPLSLGAATFVDLVPVLRRQGTECFLVQMTKQRDQLLELLKATSGLVGLSEGENGHNAERAVKQVLHQLKQLANVWQPVLPENIYNKSIGTLLNSVIVEIINSVISLEDISADDASQLHSVLSIITGHASDLYKSGTDPAELRLQQHVHKWLKYKELLVLLNAGLLEISDRWADGKGPLAHEFSANEVKQLIRALFQNTDRRAAVLARIK